MASGCEAIGDGTALTEVLRTGGPNKDRQEVLDLGTRIEIWKTRHHGLSSYAVARVDDKAAKREQCNHIVEDGRQHASRMEHRLWNKAQHWKARLAKASVVQ